MSTLAVTRSTGSDFPPAATWAPLAFDVNARLARPAPSRRTEEPFFAGAPFLPDSFAPGFSDNPALFPVRKDQREQHTTSFLPDLPALLPALPALRNDPPTMLTTSFQRQQRAHTQTQKPGNSLQ